MRIELDSSDQTITVDGVIISLELLKCLATPDPTKYYTLTRTGNNVTVMVAHNGN